MAKIKKTKLDAIPHYTNSRKLQKEKEGAAKAASSPSKSATTSKATVKKPTIKQSKLDSIPHYNEYKASRNATQNVSTKYLDDAARSTERNISTGHTMSAADRENRIDEINKRLDELTVQQKYAQNRSIAGMRGYSSKLVSDAASEYEKISQEMTALKEELEKLEMPDYISRREQIDYELGDANDVVDRLERAVSKYGSIAGGRELANASSEVREEHFENQKALAAARDAVEALEREAEQIDYLNKYKDKTYEDTFTGQTSANYRQGSIDYEASQAFAEWAKNPTEANKNYALAMNELVRKFQENNAEVLDDEGAVLPWISQSAAGYVPQFIEQTKAQALPGLAGAGVGALVGNPVLGARVGASIGSAAESYDTMRGAAIRALIEGGMSPEDAFEASKDEAFISAAIEGAGTFLTFGVSGGKAALNALGNAAVKSGSKNAAVKTVARMFSGAAADKAAAAAVKQAGKSAFRKAVDVGAGVLGEAASEYGEEFLQQGVSIANQNREDTGLWNLAREAAGVVKDAVTGNNKEAFSEMHEAGAEGFKIGLMFGGTTAVTNNVISNVVNAKTIKQKEAIIDAVLTDNETIDALIKEGKQSGENSVSARVAADIEAKRAAGKPVERGDVERLIAANDVYIEYEEQAERQQSVEQVVQRKTGYGEEGTKTFVDLLDKSSDGDMDRLQAEFQTAYELGLTDAPKAKVKLATAIQDAAFDAGKRDYILNLDKEAPKVTAHQKAGFDTTSVDATGLPEGVKPAAVPKDVTQFQVKVADTVAKALGVRVRMVSGLKGNAQINGNEVLIDENFQRKVGSSNRSLVFYVAHEIAGHRTAQASPAEWRAFQNAMIQQSNTGLSYGQMTDSELLLENYHSQDVNISLSEAMEEVAADSILGLYDSEEAFYEAVTRIMQGKDQKAKQGARKYLDKIKEIIRKLKSAIARLTGQEKADAKQTLTEMEQLRDKFEAAMKSAVENVKNPLKAESSGDTMGATKHSAYSTPSFTERQWNAINGARFSQIGLSDHKLGDIDAWVFTAKNGDPLFAIYSTEDMSDPTMLFWCKGKDAVWYKNHIEAIKEEFDNGTFRYVKTTHQKSEVVRRELNKLRRDLRATERGRKGREAAGVDDRARGGDRGSDHRRSEADSRAKNSLKSGKVETGENSHHNKKHSLKDSEGNTLTKAQTSFFENSKARDKDGNLQVYYHGTPKAGFTQFDPSKGRYGGSWFTTSRNDADSYGGNYERKLFDPNEKASTRTVESGDFRIGSEMRFDTEADRAQFIKENPGAENYRTKAEIEALMEKAQDDGDWDTYDDLETDLDSNERKRIEKAYGRYEWEHSQIKTIGDVLDNPDGYTVRDLLRAYDAYDPNNMAYDTLSEGGTFDDLIDGLKRSAEEDPELRDTTFRARVQPGQKGDVIRTVNNRTYAVYLNAERPAEFDGHGRTIMQGDFYQNIEKAMKDDSYDSVIVRNLRTGAHQEMGDVVIVKRADQVKLITNKNPTPDPDTRFSLRTDSEGNELSDQQIEFFRDSKIRDYSGHLLKVYHTTANDFTVFDKSFKGEATGDHNTYLGFFFTDDPEHMGNFDEFKGGKTKAYYLNIKNPLDMTNISKQAFLDVTEVLGGDVDEASDLYDAELAAEKQRAKVRGDNHISLQFSSLLEEMTGDYFDYADFYAELRPVYNDLMGRGYDGVIAFMDELRGVREYIVLESEQAKLTSNKKPTSNKDIRYSLRVDSDGNELSDGQVNYFKDSKVRDKQGRLLKMYHGTPSGNFTVFRDGTYFTANKDYADRYQSPSASSISTGKAADAPKTFEVYLNIKKPFDIADKAARDIYINDYIKGGNAVGVNPYMSNAEYAKIKTIDWTEGEDLRDFLIENGYDYDGLVLDEGADGGYGDAVNYRGKSYVVFSPEQVKNADNLNPTSDPDIRFSLKLQVEESEKLIAVHNVHPDKLRGTLELGGFPMPSIAITKANMSHDNFGPISVLFRKESINPSDSRNKVYGGDAWTPIRPQVGYKVNEKVRANIEKKVESLLGDRGLMRAYRLMLDDTNVDDNMNRFDGDFKRSYSRNEALKIAFLKDKGIPFRPVMKEHRYNGDLTNDALRKIVQEIGASKIIEAQRGESGAIMAFEPVVREFYNEQMRETFAGSRFLDKMVVDEVPWAKVETILRDAISLFKGGEKKVIDDVATREKLDKRFTKKLNAEYEAWLDELSNGIIEKRGIRNDKDWFTPSGNRRSFERLYMDYNLQNIVKAMAGEENQKGGGVLGTNNIFGASTKDYSSISEIRADKGRLSVQDDETHEAQKDAFSKRLGEITGRMIKPGERNMFGATLDAGDAAVEALMKGKTANGILKELKTWRRFNATREIAQDIYDLAKDISEAPTAYFEAKPRRAIGFDEVAAVIIPKNTDTDLKDQLGQRGLNVIEYNPNKDGDRLEKINSVDNIRWSLRANEDLLKENAKLKEVNTDLRNQLKRTEFAKVDKKQLDAFAKKLLKDYESGADINETRNALDGLYTYIANGEDGLAPVWNEVQKRAYEIAVSILEDASTYDDTMYQEYKQLRDRLRTVGMTISEEYDHDLMGYESINEFRKANFGRLKLVKNGIPVDAVYQELSEVYPEFFNSYEHMTQPDQLSHIVEVLDSLQPVEVNPYSHNMRQNATWLANDIIERFFDLPQAKPTFADKAQQKLTKQVIKDTKKLERERQKRREQNEKILAESREKIAKLREKEKAKRLEQVQKVKDKYKAKETKARDTRKARELRERIRTHASELSEKLLRPSDKQHIPEHLKAPVAAMLDAINLESNYTYDTFSESYKKNDEGLPTKRTRAFEDARRAYEKILQDDSTDMVIDPMMRDMFDEVTALRDIRIVDMNAQQLQTIWELLRMVEHSIYTAGKVLSNSKFQGTTEWAYAFKDDTATRKSKKGRSIESLRLDLENPYTFFSHFGKAGEAVFRMLRDAQDKQQNMVEEVKQEVRKIVSPKTVEKLENETHEFTTERGKHLTLTTAQIMEMYELMKREQAQDHLLKGGIVQPEIKAKKINRGTDAILLTIGDLSKITKVLTKEQREIADGLQRLTATLLSDYGNEASMAAYGYKKFTRKDYWPIKSAREGVHSNIEKGGNNSRSIKNIGMAKSVMPHANNPLDIGGLFQTFSNHAADMTDYAAWLLPMEDANRLFNFQFRDEDGHRTGESIKGLLDRMAGKGAQRYWHNLMEDIQNGIGSTTDTSIEGPINKMIGNVRAASVGANLRVIVQQPTAIIRAATVLDPADMAKGMTGGVTKGKGWEKALEHSAIAKRKAMGSFDISSTKKLGEVLFDSRSNLSKFNETMMKGAAAADAVTWGKIWNACEWAVKREKPSLQGDAFYQAVSEKFADVIDQSQVVDGVLQRSQTMRSSNALVKQATAFMGEPTMALNMLLRAWDAYSSETDTASRTKAKKALGRTATVLIVTNAVNALAQSLVDGLRDDDDDKKYLERVLSAFTGITGEEESAWEAAWSAVLSGNIGQNVNPVGQVPFAKDILSLLQGYNVTRADADVLGDILNASKNFAAAVSGDGKQTLPYATKNLAQQIGKMFGVSAPNILRDVWGLARTIAIETGNVALQYEMEKAISNLSSSSNKSKYLDIAYRAYEQGDMDTYKRVVADLIDAGVEPSSIQSGIRSRGKKAGVTDLYKNSLSVGIKPSFSEETEDEEDKFSIDNLTSSQYLQYSEDYGDTVSGIIDEFQRNGFDRLDQETADSLLSSAYKYASESALESVSRGKYESPTDWVNQAQDAGELGLSAAEYIMLKEEYSAASLKTEGIKKATAAGVEAETYLEMSRLSNTFKDDPWQERKNGELKTIENSRWFRLMDEINQIEGLTSSQRKIMAEELGVTKEVLKYNKAAVANKVKQLDRKRVK